MLTGGVAYVKEDLSATWVEEASKVSQLAGQPGQGDQATRTERRMGNLRGRDRECLLKQLESILVMRVIEDHQVVRPCVGRYTG